MNTAKTVPRFLLPQLSWGSALSTGSASRASAALLQQQPWTERKGRSRQGQVLGRSLHTARGNGAMPFERPLLVSSGQTTRSLSKLVRDPSLRRSLHTSQVRRRDHHFDTLKFVQRLEEEGFTEEQSVAMMKVLNDVIEESIQNLTRTMVLREDSAKATYTQKVDFAKLRSELLSADSTESNTTRAAHERLTNDIAKLNSRLRDEIGRTQASVRLDLNLEKGRIREEAVSQELKIKETETKIEQEVAALRQQLEQVKFQTLQWLMGVCTGFAALLLGAWRLLM
ncbi:hypothetical protein B0T16DRAFT_319443 [Cercophora newfieldiana]|uniref:DUF1640-domain-containing protein n=1 Tax=Cercophora newfieldiana TaxID=92897 RepID=A0AA39YR28_9PEZI|nr:hypothetical protein B0T16DRAFT_319443 [Cercophora newfieldiana]